MADIVRHARTSKRTFYDHFPTKEQCFFDLLTANNVELVDTLRADRAGRYGKKICVFRCFLTIARYVLDMAEKSLVQARASSAAVLLTH